MLRRNIAAEPTTIETMPVRNSRSVITVGLLSTVLGMAGCAGQVRYPRYYTLNLPAPVLSSSQPTLGTIAIRDFDAASFLRGGRIVYRESATELGFYDYHRWAIDPRRVVTDAVVREIQSLGSFRSVALFDGHEMSDFLLAGQIDHFEEVDERAGVSVEVSISAQLTDMKTGELLWRGDSGHSAQLDQRSVSGVVQQLSVETNLAIRKLAASIRDRLDAKAAAAKR